MNKLVYDQLIKNLDIDNNFDIVKKEVGIGNKNGVLFYLSSLISEASLFYLLSSLKFSNKENSYYFDNFNGSIKKLTDEDDLLDSIYSGIAILFFNKGKQVLLIDIRMYPARSVQEPDTEKTVRGSRDGFNETLITNIALIRRRIKDPSLKVELYTISSKSKCKVALCYLNDVIDQHLLELIKDKINSLDLESLVMSDRALEENLFKQKLSIYPLVRYTERPDVASISLINGKAIILVDTSASAIITPITLIDHFRHVEEYRQNPIVGSFSRTIRSIAIFLSVILVPTFMLLLSNKEYANVIQIDLSKEINTPLLFQVLIATLIIEIFRIAMIHTPTPLVSALSLVAAIILGQVSMDLGLFLPEILLFVCLSTICGFATPSYELSLANKLVQVLLILIVALFNVVGFYIALILLFLYLVQIKVFSFPYLYPFCPFDLKGIQSLFIRESANKRNKN